MTTKERILDAALQLFNEQGIDVITIRHIAKALDMSHGNLQYHYKNNDEIITALFRQLIEAMSAHINNMTLEQEYSFRRLMEQTEQVFDTFYQYRFIFLHFVEITRRIPAIKTEYSNLDKIRQDQLMHLFNIYRNKGIFRKDIPEEIWRELITEVLYIVADFWLSHNEVKLNLKGKKAVKHYHRLFCHLFYPYLTAKGRQAWTEMT
ncbi:TetR/AcrR family transcriptional regulator [Chitinophaga vietnamensis]|uniref:TetR/AcrR family transcriptional regulator n=1 Tax=Chitinophaga vietnamensis TaxID=2593957 RepID=UPI001177BF37|nr:TetR/AcrR family transcriptional regulator [Chitinophaga vietnamensis]